MYLTIVILPLLGSIASGLFGRKIGVQGSYIITCSSVVITTLLSIIAFFEIGMNNIPVRINLIRWIDIESVYVIWGFNFDSLTVSMLIPVLTVSSLVHIYSIGYMSQDPHNQRFFSYLSLFTFMMIILVTANNLLLMFVGWEGVGICSYLLVSFWFTRIAANQSSMSAFLTNRVGDCLLTIGIFATLWSFGNIDYATIFSLAPYMNENIITFIGICILIGAMAKSSQIGLHVWLPQAMEGPTPVSALIHAATMVTAGVYLLIRSSPLIEYSPIVLIICLWIGSITTVFSSLIGLFQQDIKKVIAYSTMSQLGMMVIAVGLSSYNLALFHLVNHAFYKALLFLGAGAVIHAVADNQDFRKYGGLIFFLPLTYSVMLIASLSLVAIPYMTGFYSKDFILESAYGQFFFSSIVVYFIATIGAMFTTLYSVKVLYLTFLTNPNGPLINYNNAHEANIYMSLPLIILAIFSIFFGYIYKDLFIGLGSGFFMDNSIYIHPYHEIMLNTEFAVPTFFKLLPLVFTISLSIVSLIISELLPKLLINFKFTKLGYNIFGFFNQRFLVELFYNNYITGTFLKLGGQTTKIIDKGSVELLGPFGLEKSLLSLSNSINNLSTGVITSYALFILIGLNFFVGSFFFNLSNNSLLILILFNISFFINIKNSDLLLKKFKTWTFTKPHPYVTLPLQSSYNYITYVSNIKLFGLYVTCIGFNYFGHDISLTIYQPLIEWTPLKLTTLIESTPLNFDSPSKDFFQKYKLSDNMSTYDTINSKQYNFTPGFRPKINHSFIIIQIIEGFISYSTDTLNSINDKILFLFTNFNKYNIVYTPLIISSSVSIINFIINNFNKYIKQCADNNSSSNRGPESSTGESNREEGTNINISNNRSVDLTGGNEQDDNNNNNNNNNNINRSIRNYQNNTNEAIMNITRDVQVARRVIIYNWNMRSYTRTYGIRSAIFRLQDQLENIHTHLGCEMRLNMVFLLRDMWGIIHYRNEIREGVNDGDSMRLTYERLRERYERLSISFSLYLLDIDPTYRDPVFNRLEDIFLNGVRPEEDDPEWIEQPPRWLDPRLR